MAANKGHKKAGGPPEFCQSLKTGKKGVHNAGTTYEGQTADVKAETGLLAPEHAASDAGQLVGRPVVKCCGHGGNRSGAGHVKRTKRGLLKVVME